MGGNTSGAPITTSIRHLAPMAAAPPRTATSHAPVRPPRTTAAPSVPMNVTVASLVVPSNTAARTRANQGSQRAPNTATPPAAQIPSPETLVPTANISFEQFVELPAAVKFKLSVGDPNSAIYRVGDPAPAEMQSSSNLISISYFEVFQKLFNFKF